MRILNFGSLNLDKTYTVPHFVQPGETLSSTAYAEYCGGKGLNQSVALARAGAEVWHAGKIGQDGGILTETLERSGVNTSLLRVEEQLQTGHAIIQIDQSGQNCILLFGGANQAVDSPYIHAVLERFGPGDWLLLQNEISGLPEIIALARERGMTIVLNPSPMTENLRNCGLEHVNYFLLNELEGAALSGVPQTDPDRICDGLLAAYPSARVVLTLGGDGALYADGQSRCRQPAFSVPVVDTTAAGDTFTGYFLTCVLEGQTPAQAMETAAMAAAIAVGRPGASPSIPLREEVEQARRTLSQ